jgi:hypothetical protein
VLQLQVTYLLEGEILHEHLAATVTSPVTDEGSTHTEIVVNNRNEVLR